MKNTMTGTTNQQPDTSPLLPQYVVVYPLQRRYHRHYNTCQLNTSCCISLLTLFLLLISTTYVLWPSDPQLSITRLKLDHIQIHTRPISLSVKLDLTIAVRNRDFYSINYGSLRVEILYRGNKLGNASSDGGRVKARGVSYVDATLDLDGVEVLSDVILLIEDLAKGVIEFDTVTEVKGKLGLFFFDVPLKAKIACEVIVNTRNQTISRQNCYPQLSQPQLDVQLPAAFPPISQLI